MGEVGEKTQTIDSQILRKHVNIVINISIDASLHVPKYHLVNPNDCLMHLFW